MKTPPDSSRPLDRPRQERLAQALACGETPRAAMRLAGYSGQMARAKAWEYRRLPHIEVRVRWLQKSARSSPVDPVWRTASTAPVNVWVLAAVEGVPLEFGVFAALRDGGIPDDPDPWMDVDGNICDPQPTHWTVIRLPQRIL